MFDGTDAARNESTGRHPYGRRWEPLHDAVLLHFLALPPRRLHASRQARRSVDGDEDAERGQDEAEGAGHARDRIHVCCCPGAAEARESATVAQSWWERWDSNPRPRA